MPRPLFQHLNGVPVTRTEFDEWLATVITHCGLDSTKYKGHSFRIGAASHAAACGYSDLKSVYLGGGSWMPLKGIFAVLVFHTAQHSTNRKLYESNLAVDWSDIGRGCAVVCRWLWQYFFSVVVLHS